MSPARWLNGELAAFDTETTGVDTTKARIVTATLLRVGPSGVTRRESWLVNPGIEIPAEATAIHGITTSKAQAEGIKPQAAIPGIARELLSVWKDGLPLVIMNAPYDLALVQSELQRLEHSPIAIGPVLDPLVIDRAQDPFRKGKRNLAALAQHYKVKQDTAHDSRGDALTAARIVWRQAQVYRHLSDMSLEAMQDLQRNAHRDWADGFEKYLRGQGKPDVIERDWPVRRLKGAA